MKLREKKRGQRETDHRRGADGPMEPQAGTAAPGLPKQIGPEQQHHPAEVKFGIVRPEPARAQDQPKHSQRGGQQADGWQPARHGKGRSGK